MEMCYRTFNRTAPERKSSVFRRGKAIYQYQPNTGLTTTLLLCLNTHHPTPYRMQCSRKIAANRYRWQLTVAAVSATSNSVPKEDF